MKKLFIFDGDGVLLDLWGAMKSVYEKYTGTLLTTAEWDKVIIDFLHNPYPYAEFGRYFDASTTFGNLPPVKGMPELVNYAYSCGYNLAVITSVDNTENLVTRRSRNIWQYYGNKLSKVICTGRFVSKEKALQDTVKGYDKILFCDDHPKNLIISRGIVTTPIWLRNQHHQFIWDKLAHDGIEVAESVSDLRCFIK